MTRGARAEPGSVAEACRAVQRATATLQCLVIALRYQEFSAERIDYDDAAEAAATVLGAAMKALDQIGIKKGRR